MQEEMDFDQFADNYRSIHTENIKGISGVDSDYFSEYKILEVRDLLENKTILDLGCGDGNSAKYIEKNCKEYNYHGIDLSEKSIINAQKKNFKNCVFLSYDGENIPYSEAYFDVIFISCVFHHIDASKHLNLLRECNRVLRKGGKLIIFEHNPWNPLTLKTVHDCPFDEGVVLINNMRMKRNIKKAGFQKVFSNFTIFMPRKSFFLKLLEIEKYLRKIPVGGQYYCVAEK